MTTAALLVVTAAYSAYSQQQAGKAQERLSNKNADLIDAQAADAIARGEEDVMAKRVQIRRTVGAQRAAYAAQGVEINNGTAADIQNQTGEQGAYDEGQIRKNAFREAWGLKGSASNQRLSGRYARQAGNNNAAGTLLGGAAAAYPYYRADAPVIAGGRGG